MNKITFPVKYRSGDGIYNNKTKKYSVYYAIPTSKSKTFIKRLRSKGFKAKQVTALKNYKNKRRYLISY